MLAGAATLLLMSCQPPAPPVVTAPPPPPPPVDHRLLTSGWSFHTGEACTATASNPDLTLEVTASSSKLQLIARFGHGIETQAGKSAPIAFNGGSGNWTVAGRFISQHRAIASKAMTEDEAGQILLLLKGGIVTIGRRDDGLPRLRVPNAGAPGSEWFDCVRRLLFP